MRVLLSAGSLDLSNGGPSENVPMLARHLAALGVEVGVASGQRGRLHESLAGSNLRVFIPSSSIRIVAPWSLVRAVWEFRPDIVHDNGLWRPENALVALAARAAGAKLVVSPRGMLEPWAVKYHAVRKRVAWTVFQRRILEQCDAIVATAEPEKANIASLVPGRPIYVVANGWSRLGGAPDSDDRPRAQRVALFFSRVHPKKGVELLLQAWATVRPEGWLLKIVGPGDKSYVQDLIGLARKLGVGSTVEFGSPRYQASEKAELIGGASVVVLPSFSENFGSIVVEALGHGVPVITTTGTPWAELPRIGAGWWIEPTVEGLSRALNSATLLPERSLRDMGRRGAQLVSETFGWPVVAKRMVEVYQAVSTSVVAASG